MDETTFAHWLDRYKTAWESRDPDAAADLFTTDGSYRETPFDAAMQGRAAIRAYWAAGPRDSQRDVAFAYEVWAVLGGGRVGVCRWRCSFTRIADGGRVELDGVFRCAFATEGREAGRCQTFEEWWHER
jgi:nuclear transport factor 2 (NTF2) superfamily protein